uniref:G_PROTEIN_RECEP_F1_2 domain-containing protein n=1 Tax=Meloidogyne hapla TaxID=6305 RepID=A0A1I8BHH7_MELHA
MSGSYLVLAEFVIALVFHSISVYRILMILYTKFQSQKAFSLYFMALLVNWLITSSLLIPYEVYSAIVWRPQPGTQNSSNVRHVSLTLFLFALPCHLFMAMLPVTLFFLTVDRIFIIKFGAHYGYKIKQIFKIAYFTSLFVCVCVNTTGFLLALPLPEYTECEIFGCILDSAVQFYLGWRVFCAIFNISSGIIFFFLLCRTNQHLLKQSSQLKNSAGYQHFLRTNKAVFGPGSSMGTGPLSEFMSSIEVFIFCSIYSHVLRIGMEHSSGVIGAETVGIARNQIAPAQSTFRASPSG